MRMSVDMEAQRCSNALQGGASATQPNTTATQPSTTAAAADLNLETAAQDAWQLLSQGSGPMHIPEDAPGAPGEHENATAPAHLASVALSQNINLMSKGAQPGSPRIQGLDDHFTR